MRPVRPGDPSLLLADMSAPVVFLQNVETAIKPPFSSDETVLSAIRQARRRFKLGLVALYPGRLIFTISPSWCCTGWWRRLPPSTAYP